MPTGRRRLGANEMDGFGVNVDALKTAGLSTAELMAILSETQVEDVDCDGAGGPLTGATGRVAHRAPPVAGAVSAAV